MPIWHYGWPPPRLMHLRWVFPFSVLQFFTFWIFFFSPKQPGDHCNVPPVKYTVMIIWMQERGNCLRIHWSDYQASPRAPALSHPSHPHNPPPLPPTLLPALLFAALSQLGRQSFLFCEAPSLEPWANCSHLLTPLHVAEIHSAHSANGRWVG